MTFFGLKIGSGFGELHGTPLPRIPRSSPLGCSTTGSILMSKISVSISLPLSLLIVCISAIQCYM